jgi:hypothetical protein
MKTLSEKLAENLSYYVENTNRRCYTLKKNGDKACFYSGKTANKKTQGCFVGRLLKPNDRLKADEFFGTDNHFSSDVLGLIKACDSIGIKLPEIITENENLMSYFQSLHDSNSNWDENGLSNTGKHNLEEIIKRFELDKKPFKKFL